MEDLKKMNKELENVVEYVSNIILDSIFEIEEMSDDTFYLCVDLVYILNIYNRRKILKNINKGAVYNKSKKIDDIIILLNDKKIYNGLFNVQNALLIIKKKHKNINLDNFILHINRKIDEFGDTISNFE